MLTMIELRSGREGWHWGIAAAVLAIVEAMAPGAVAIWFAAAAAVVGTLLLVVPMPWQLQLGLFGGLSFAALALWRRWKRTHPETSTLPNLNQRAAQYIGKGCVLSEPIIQGSGKAEVGGGHWKGRVPDR